MATADLAEDSQDVGVGDNWPPALRNAREMVRETDLDGEAQRRPAPRGTGQMFAGDPGL